MTRFAFIIHPLQAKDFARRYPILKFMSDGFIEKLLSRKEPFKISEVTGIKSITGAETEGIFVALPVTPHMFMESMPLEWVYDRITQCTRIAEDEGCEIIGLGAFTSVVGDGGITVAQRSNIAVTTGNSYTVATAIEGAVNAAGQLGILTGESVLAVVGATGSIGKTCARALAPEFGRTVVVGRDLERTQVLASELPRAEATVNIDAIRDADVVITVTSADAPVILPEHLKSGSVVCDVARPRDVSVRVSKERPDVLVIEGGVVRVPGDVNFNFDFGFPPMTAYACMSETIMLALENRPESFTLGKDVSIEQVNETQRLAKRHGFRLAGFRSFEREVDESTIARVRNARNKLVPT